jgi:hypothetical protein
VHAPLIDQDARILRLERELRRTRAIAAGGVLLVVALPLSGSGRAPREVIEAERIELVSSSGLRQAILSSDTAGFIVTLVDARNEPAGGLRLTAEPRLMIETARGRGVAGLGAPKAHKLRE